MNEKEILKKYLARLGRRGGKQAAARMTKAERVARAKKAGLSQAASRAKRTKGEKP